MWCSPFLRWSVHGKSSWDYRFWKRINIRIKKILIKDSWSCREITFWKNVSKCLTQKYRKIGCTTRRILEKVALRWQSIVSQGWVKTKRKFLKLKQDMKLRLNTANLTFLITKASMKNSLTGKTVLKRLKLFRPTVVVIDISPQMTMERQVWQPHSKASTARNPVASYSQEVRSLRDYQESPLHSRELVLAMENKT